MSKWDKLLERICSLSKGLRFEELRKVLESFGYVMNAQIQKAYVEMVKQVVESEGVNENTE